jgi:hypothetical protein
MCLPPALTFIYKLLRNKVNPYFVASRQNLCGKPEQILDKKHEKSMKNHTEKICRLLNTLPP